MLFASTRTYLKLYAGSEWVAVCPIPQCFLVLTRAFWLCQEFDFLSWFLGPSVLNDCRQCLCVEPSDRPTAMELFESQSCEQLQFDITSKQTALMQGNAPCIFFSMINASNYWFVVEGVCILSLPPSACPSQGETLTECHNTKTT